jgi:hypothetical protein
VDDAKAVRSVESYDLPLLFRIGVAYDIDYGSNNRFTFTVEARDPADNEQQASLGGELAFNEQFFVRAGWKINYAEEGVALGGGLHLPLWEQTEMRVDYAWGDFGRLASVHRFSIGFRF